MDNLAEKSEELRKIVVESRKGTAEISTDAKPLIEEIVTCLRAISECPKWSLVHTEQHRPAMLSLIRSSRKRMAIGSDSIRKGGLDESTISEISRRPGEVENRSSKFSISIFWAHHPVPIMI